MTDDNPWESAAATSDTWSQSSFSMDPERGTTTPSRQQQRRRQQQQQERNDLAASHLGIPTSGRASMSSQLILGLHILDGIVGIGCLIYGAIVHHRQERKRDQLEALFVLFGGGTLLVVRSFSGWTQSKCGYRISGMISLIASCWYFLLSMIVLGMTLKGSLRRYLKHHPDIPLLSKFMRDHEHSLWATFLGLCFAECIRWALAQRELANLQFLEEAEHFHLESRIDGLASGQSPNSQRGRSPWWWKNSNQNQLNQSLLDRPSGTPNWASTTTQQYHISDGISQSGHNNRSSWWPWASSANTRDDASVEYASLNEDWASRSEEDPLWWSKEGDGQQQQQQQQQQSSTDTPSWAE